MSKKNEAIQDQFKITLAEPKYLVNALAIIKELHNEVRINIDSDRLEIKEYDPANVELTHYELYSSTCTEWNVSEPVDISVNVSNLLACIKKVKPYEILTLSKSIGEDKIGIIIKGDYEQIYKQPLIEFVENKTMIPSLEPLATITLPSKRFEDELTSVSNVSDSITFRKVGETFYLEGTGDLSNVSIPNHPTDEVKIVGTDCTSKYSIEYLKQLVKAKNLASEVTIKFGTDYPLTLEYNAPDKYLLELILAPRVD